LAYASHADPKFQARRLDLPGGEPSAIALGGLDDEPRVELLHKGVDLGFGDGGIGKYSDQSADRKRVLRLADDAPQSPACGRLTDIGDLGRLNVDEILALADRGAFFLGPLNDFALNH
jgi:hypothetical protein